MLRRMGDDGSDIEMYMPPCLAGIGTSSVQHGWKVGEED